MSRILPDNMVLLEALIPYDMQKLISLIHQKGTILSEEYEENGTRIKARVPQREMHNYSDYITGGEDEKPNH
jgi:GTP-binding protein HflX